MRYPSQADQAVRELNLNIAVRLNLGSEMQWTCLLGILYLKQTLT